MVFITVFFNYIKIIFFCFLCYFLNTFFSFFVLCYFVFLKFLYFVSCYFFLQFSSCFFFIFLVCLCVLEVFGGV